MESMRLQKRFKWNKFDVNHLLPSHWVENITEFANANYFNKTIIPRSVTSRERYRDLCIPVQTVGGKKIREGLLWLYNLYKSDFLELGQRCVEEPLTVAQDDRYAINLNIQRGTAMRYECHIDSNPLEGLLYVTPHPKGSGGETIFSNDPTALGPEEISRDCVELIPEPGILYFFDAREFPHYVAPLKNGSNVRIVVAMNFYTPSCSEADRPKDLNAHLGLN